MQERRQLTDDARDAAVLLCRHRVFGAAERRGERAAKRDAEWNDVVLCDPTTEREHRGVEHRRVVGDSGDGLGRDAFTRVALADDDPDLLAITKRDEHARAGVERLASPLYRVRERPKKRQRQRDVDEHWRKIALRRALCAERYPITLCALRTALCVTPRPGASGILICPRSIVAPSYGSSASSAAPSKSAWSRRGEKCAAAVMPRLDSIMQPVITIMPNERAVAIMRSASRRPPHFDSLMLIPSTTPASFATSVATTHDSSAMIGSADRSRTKRSPSRSCAGRGCSTNSTPCSTSKSIMCSARFVVHAAFASTRRTFVGAARRTARMISSSRSLPSLILSTGY